MSHVAGISLSLIAETVTRSGKCSSFAGSTVERLQTQFARDEQDSDKQDDCSGAAQGVESAGGNGAAQGVESAGGSGAAQGVERAGDIETFDLWLEGAGRLCRQAAFHRWQAARLERQAYSLRKQAILCRLEANRLSGDLHNPNVFSVVPDMVDSIFSHVFQRFNFVIAQARKRIEEAEGELNQVHFRNHLEGRCESKCKRLQMDIDSNVVVAEMLARWQSELHNVLESIALAYPAKDTNLAEMFCDAFRRRACEFDERARALQESARRHIALSTKLRKEARLINELAAFLRQECTPDVYELDWRHEQREHG
ncbi:MAG TPA: hypothetical protein V6D17_05040 [Candidatus Obscuribacterales bacterium]